MRQAPGEAVQGQARVALALVALTWVALVQVRLALAARLAQAVRPALVALAAARVQPSPALKPLAPAPPPSAWATTPAVSARKNM